jgi:tryptophan synthase alpha chain
VPGQIAQTFARTGQAGRAALVGYLPAGFPSVEGGVAAIRAIVEAGADIVEIGLPYSDPTMDGPVIQDAVTAALAAGTTTRDVLRTVEAVASAGAPTLVMTYWNPVDRYGVEAFARDLAAAGGAGVITPDLPPEEAGPWLAACAQFGLDPVFVVAPNSSDERLRRVCDVAGGFVYAAALMGVTGARATLGAQAGNLVRRLRAVTDLPLAVGLGVSTAEQAAEAAGFADGVIVGTALVRAVLAAHRGGADVAGGGAALAELRELTAALAAGVRAGRPAPATAG